MGTGKLESGCLLTALSKSYMLALDLFVLDCTIKMIINISEMKMFVLNCPAHHCTTKIVTSKRC